MRRLRCASRLVRRSPTCSRTPAPARRGAAAARRIPAVRMISPGFVSPWIRPSVAPSRSPDAAPAAGDDLGGDADRGLLRRAGAEVEPDRAGQPASSSSVSPASRSRASRSSWVRREPIAPTYGRPRAAAAPPRAAGTSNFGSWVSTASTVRWSIRPASTSACEVAVRPVDDHLVGLGEPAGRREHRPGVADGHVVAEEAADPGHRGGEVDRAEDQHPRLRRERPHEDPHPLAAALAVGAVGQRRVVARRRAGRARRRGPRRRPAARVRACRAAPAPIVRRRGGRPAAGRATPGRGAR